MNVKEITDNIYYVGVNDRTLTLFEGLWPLPYGVTYNSYVVKGEKSVALIDTVNIDEVIIILHGGAAGEKGNGVGVMWFDGSDTVEPSYIYANSSYINESNWSRDTSIETLAPKTIGTLTFSSCNSGNPDIYNMTYAFMQRMNITKQITAWDGGTSFSYRWNMLRAGAAGEENQHTWYKFVDRDANGHPVRTRWGQRQWYRMNSEWVHRIFDIPIHEG